MKNWLNSVHYAWLFNPGVNKLRQSMLELRRLMTLRKREATVFLQVDDPYSYLLSYYLAFLRPQYGAKVRFRYLLCQALSGRYSPQPALLAEFALRDCALLATELGVPFLDMGATPPVEHRRHLLDFLANEQGETDFEESATKALALYWRGDADGMSRFLGRVRSDGSDTHVLIGKHQLLLRRMGHYQCASIYYAGEWYWGIDRLHYLLARLDARKLNRYKDAAPELASLKQTMTCRLPVTPPAMAAKLPPLELFYALPDPYSHLALQQAASIADAFGLTLNLRVVMPADRLPKNQQRYRLKDAKREADRLQLPFGKLADVSESERLLPAFFYAKSQHRERAFLQHVGHALFAEGLDASSDEGLKTVADQSGLFWPDMRAALESADWQAELQSNEAALLSAGHWSAPVTRIGSLVVRGHDRDWLIAKRLEDGCQNSEGFIE